MGKPVSGISEQVRQKPFCKATEDSYMLEISDLGSRGIVLSNGAFVFVYVKSRFSYAAAKL